MNDHAFEANPPQEDPSLRDADSLCEIDIESAAGAVEAAADTYALDVADPVEDVDALPEADPMEEVGAVIADDPVQEIGEPPEVNAVPEAEAEAIPQDERVQADEGAAVQSNNYREFEEFSADMATVMEDWRPEDALREGLKLGQFSPGDQPECTEQVEADLSVEDLAHDENAWVVDQMLQERQQKGLACIKSMSEQLYKQVLASDAKFGRGELTLVDLASENPEQFKQLFEAWSEKQADNKVRDSTFPEFVSVRMREFRGIEGEQRLAFSLGPDSLMVQAPGRINEPGIDLITFTNGEIQLRDNKAINGDRALTKVSALEWNLPKNLSEATKAVSEYIEKAGEDLPPALSSKVLPAMQAASEAITTWVADHPAENLKSTEVQQTFAAILKQHGISRVIDFEAAAGNARSSSRLTSRGFEDGRKLR